MGFALESEQVEQMITKMKSSSLSSLSPINFVFLSCHFPPRFRFFVKQLKSQGVSVLGIGDEFYYNLHPELIENLTEYYKVDNMENYEELYRCLGFFVHKHGRIQFIESFNEHWLETEAKLREDFNIKEGYNCNQMAIYKRKSGMKKVYQAAGLKCAPGMLPKTLDEALTFANKVGYPLIMKPDIGVGAAGATKIRNDEELKKNWDGLGNSFMEKFIDGTIETFDGLCDHEGKIIFYSSMKYRGLMEVVSGEDMIFYVCKDVPEDLREMGFTTVKAFEVKARFFHCEFFRNMEGELLPLEINLRPPGVITLDIMNYTYRTDLYAEYAKVITKQKVSEYKEAEHFGCYASRRNNVPYKYSGEEVEKKMGSKLEFTYAMPDVYSALMGNFSYVFTATNVEEMQNYINLILSPPTTCCQAH